MFVITMSDHMLIISIKRLTRLVMGLNNPVTKFTFAFSTSLF